MNLVTGGTGMLGMRLLFDLSKLPEATRAIVRSKNSLVNVKKIFSFYGDTSGSLFEKIEWVDGNILDVASIENAMQGCQKVYHCAAVVSFVASENKNMFKTNVEGTANIVNVCLANGNVKLCYVSSVAALGKNDNHKSIDEDTKWKSNPLNSNYAISKYLAEREVWRGVEEGLEAVIVNPTIILGAAHNENSSGSLMRRLASGSPFYTRGSNGFVDVRNVADTMIQLMHGNTFSQRFILNGENLSYKKLLDQSAEIWKVSKPKFRAKEWLLEIAWRMAWFVSLFNKNRPFLTKETVAAGNMNTVFSGNKLGKIMPATFYNVNESLMYYSRFYN